MLQKALFTAVVAATAAASMNASAIGRLADITVIDRSTGQSLPVHYYRGEYWVAGTPGAKYSVAVANATGGRVLAVMSVDGVNVLNGQTASTDQSGYVFNGHQRYEVTGWRKSNSEVAAFEFVASPASYAERTGRPANVGVIGVALFKERAYQPPVAVTPPPWTVSPRKSAETGAGAAGRAADGVSNSAQSAPPAPAPASGAALSALGHGADQFDVAITQMVRLLRDGDVSQDVALRPGDTLYRDVPVEFPPIPSFSPEHFAVARGTDPSKHKQFRRGIEQLEQEGVVQVLRSERRGEQAPVLAAVGPMQFEVASHRMAAELSAPISLEPLPYQVARVVDPADADFVGRQVSAEVLTRTDGVKLALFSTPWRLQGFQRDNPDVKLSALVAAEG